MEQLTLVFLGSESHPQVALATMKSVPGRKALNRAPLLALEVYWQP